VVILSLTLFSANVFAETIIKDANGVEYFADRIIVKIKSSLPAKGAENALGESRRLMRPAEASGSVQSLMSKWAITESKALFPRIVPPTSKMNLSAVAVTTKQREFEKLGNIFVLKLPAGTDIRAARADFAKDSHVEYAEPVYIFRLCMEPNDPLFAQQWYLHNTGQYKLEDADIDAPEAWEINQGSANPVIAIIDTGVDLDHPDLINQIWQNPNEQSGDGNGDGSPGWVGFDDDGDGLIDEDSQGRQPGEPGYNNDLVNDDDENGYNDDFIGWNWIDENNNPQDDHGHGTHCAGIAAAETNNGVGIAGVCPNGKIMPLKAFQSSGAASSEDIAKAIEYAYKNGADVISMSFTGPDSALIRNATELAYSRSVLVAASGNGGEKEGIRYPAYYSWVIGVGATDIQWDSETLSYKEVIADFTNTTNADIYAPGVNIRSTLLDNTYASWSGTSMATPVVAGIAGLLISEKTGGFWGPDLYQGQILNAGDAIVEKTIFPIINGYAVPTIVSGQRISADKVLINVPEPYLVRESYRIDDSTGDNDGRPDAGETINLYFTIRNTYGNATGVTATLSTSDALATIIDPNANYGNIGPSASEENIDDPITVHISPDAGNNRDIVFNFQADANNGGSGINENIVLTVQRGTEVSGVINSNTTWTKDNLYIVTDDILVSYVVTLTIEPGTIVRFDDGKYMQVDGELIAIGTPEQPITFTANGSTGWLGFKFSHGSVGASYGPNGEYIGGSTFQFCIVTKTYNRGDEKTLAPISIHGGGPYIYRNIITQNIGYWAGGFTIWNPEHSGPPCAPKICCNLISDNDGINSGSVFHMGPNSSVEIESNLFFNNRASVSKEGAGAIYFDGWGEGLINHNIFLDNYGWKADVLSGLLGTPVSFHENSILNLSASGYLVGFGSLGTNQEYTSNYWGPSTTAEMNEKGPDADISTIYDFHDDFGLADVNYSNWLQNPVCDENSPPYLVDVNVPSYVGAGPIQFQLTFNRQMNSLLPTVSFGPTEPYTQHMVTDGNWVNSTTWEGTYPITLFTGDGIQTIRVSGAKEPDNWFEIPEDTRFSFEIDTAGLSGVNLQASGEVSRVDLFFNPVDEPDLAGYNVYRSDVTGGPYTKINPAVVVEPNYSDYTAPPGITKYYVVAAVRTDFTESDYSDEAYAAALDGTPPVITHTPVIDRNIVGPPGITIQATITDVGTGVSGAALHYKKTSATSYSSIIMTNPSGNLWSANIPGSAITLEGIDYYITAEDNSPYSDTAYNGRPDSPHHIIVYTEKCGPVSVPAGPSTNTFCTTNVRIDISANDTTGEITVYRMEASAPNITTPTLQRHWAIRGLDSSAFSANLIFSYTDSDLIAAGLDEDNLVLRKSADGGHTYQIIHTATNSSANTAETIYKQTSFSIWTINTCSDFGFPPGDINKNCYVDLNDFAILGDQWLQPPGIPSADIAPSGGDGVVNYLDLSWMADHWLEGTTP
jgi:subtilisin family serine protease